MNFVILVLLALFSLFFVMSIAAYMAIEDSILGGVVIAVVIIAALLMVNFLWREK